MSIRRLLATTAAMALIARSLAAITPNLDTMAAALASGQRTADAAGPDALIVSAVGLLAWAAWGWGVLGLALTTASALPGLMGSAARAALLVALPAAARRSAALALGVGLGVAGPLVGTGAPFVPAPAAAATGGPDGPAPPSASPAPDWPASPDVGPAPDWPHASPTGDRRVVPGDCLWHIATDRLLDLHGRAPTDGEVAAATHAWWQANAEVIGPDPDLLIPGQVLTPP